MTNFEFDHNYVFRCGVGGAYKDASIPYSDRPGQAMKLVNLKDSSIHHNEIDARGIYSGAIRGIGGYWNNVDVYNNIFRASDTNKEGWMGPSPRWKSNFVVEVWAHIGGSEYYNNVSNDGFSIMDYKDGVIHHNILVRHSAPAIGIETGALHDSSAHHNYIYGGKGSGIVAAFRRPYGYANGAIYENIISNVGTWGIGLAFKKSFCRGGLVPGIGVFFRDADPPHRSSVATFRPPRLAHHYRVGAGFAQPGVSQLWVQPYFSLSTPPLAGALLGESG